MFCEPSSRTNVRELGSLSEVLCLDFSFVIHHKFKKLKNYELHDKRICKQIFLYPIPDINFITIHGEDNIDKYQQMGYKKQNKHYR